MYLLALWRPKSQSFDQLIPVRPSLRLHLFWWKEPENLLRGAPLRLPPPHQVVVHGCVHHRMGSASRRTDGSGTMVQRPTQTTHQLAGTPGCVSCTPTVQSGCYQPACHGKFRQCYGCCVHKQDGGKRSPALCLSLIHISEPTRRS